MEQHHLEKIKCAKHFFIKSFVVSLVLFVISVLILMIGHDYYASMAETMYGIEGEDFALVFAMSLAIWKILIIQFTFIPAIVMLLIEKHIKKRIEEETI